MTVDNPNPQALARIRECGVIAVLRLPSIEFLSEIASALLAGGVTNIELTMTTPDATTGISRLAEAFSGRVVVGVGTVLDAESCRKAVAAGAQYVVSPGFDPAVHACVRELGRLSFPGALTPTEILRAWSAGADVVKVFPSTHLGPGYFRDVLAPLPHLKLMPTGGVTLQNVAQWIRAGAFCVGAGSALVPLDALAKRDWKAITANARGFVESVREARR